MSKIDQSASIAEQEAQFMAQAEDFVEKSAAAILEEEFVRVEESRFEERAAPSPDEEEEGSIETPPPEGAWSTTPSVRNQAIDYPEAVRLVDPETKILNLSDPEHLAEFNRIQKGASDPEAPVYAVTDLDKQPYEGSWTAFITFHKVQYLSI